MNDPSFRTLSDVDLRQLHSAILGRDMGLRSRSALTTSLARRRKVAKTTHIFAGGPSVNTFKGLRVSMTPRPEQQQRTPREARESIESVTETHPRKKHISIALASVGVLLQLMKVDVAENDQVRERLLEFMESPQNAMRSWVESCEHMRRRLTGFKYLRLLCVGLSTSPTKKDEEKGDEHKYVDYSDTVDAKRAEWVLCRRFERGPTYMVEIWKGLNRPELSATCDGFYFVHNAASLRALYERNLKSSRLRDKIRLIRESVAAKKRVTREDEDADETDEIFGDFNDSDENDVPTLHASIDPATGLMHLSMCLSPSQHAAAMDQRSNPDGLTSNSPMLFRATAGCVGVDSWLIFTSGPWHNKLLQFVRKFPAAENAKYRNESMDVEAVIVDQVVFAKRFAAPCTKLTDIFVCTRCGAERDHNNYVYATKFGDLRRGHYQCAVCEKLTVHVSKTAAQHQSRPRWQTTKTVPQEPVIGLSQFGFDR